MASPEQKGRAAARARREAQIQGKSALRSGGTAARPPSRSPSQDGGDARTASMARREALAGAGKAALARPERTRSDAPDLSAAAHDAPEPTPAPAPAAPVRASAAPRAAAPAKPPNLSQGRMLSQARRRAISSAGKKGTETHRGGAACAQVARQINPDISGRDLSKAVREERARNGRAGGQKSPPTGRRRPDRAASDATTGTAVGPGGRETGAEVGLCRDVTGTRYMSGDVFDRFCQTEPPRAPRKVSDLRTLRGGTVTGTSVAPGAAVTGADAGRCRTVTGDEYLGSDHFSAQCGAAPRPTSPTSPTSPAPRVSGARVTGGARMDDERHVSRTSPDRAPGSDPVPVTGTGSGSGADPVARRAPSAASPAPGGAATVTGARLGGQRISGTFSLGEGKVTGTEERRPGADRSRPAGPMPAMAMARKPVQAAEPPPAPAPAPMPAPAPVAIEFAAPPAPAAPAAATGAPEPAEPAGPAPAPAEPPRPRITGEGMDGGTRITGNDWNRGDRVTGTEGQSASGRNPSWRGATPSRAAPDAAPRAARVTERASDFLVTGSSGNTERGARVTVSGGARG
jgi:hypothetical protein